MFTLTITKKLLESLSLLSRIAAGNKSTAAVYPNAIKFDTKGMLHAANSLNSVSCKLSTEELGLVPELPDKDFLLPDKAISFVKALSVGTEVSFDLRTELKLSVKTGKRKSTAKFPVMTVENFKPLSPVKPESLQMIKSEWFINALKQCEFALSDNPGKPIYTCLHLIGEQDGSIVAFSCDGMKAALTVNNEDKAEKSFKVSIPPETQRILLSAKYDDKIRIGFCSGRSAVFQIDSTTVLRTQLYEGSLLDYSNLYGKAEHSLKFDKDILLAVLKKINLIADEKHTAIRFIVSDSTVKITYNGTVTYEDTIVVSDNTDKEECTIGMNYKFLTDALQSCDASEVELRYHGSTFPVEVKGNFQNNLIVPVKI